MSSGHRPDGEFTQKHMSALYHKNRRDRMVSSAGVWDRARLEATAAPHSGAWLDALPSCALDTQLSNAEIQYGVGRRLGVELCEQAPCPLCLGVMDKWGAHCECCTSGGDKTVTHNKIRDDLYLQARKARTAPQHEAFFGGWQGCTGCWYSVPTGHMPPFRYFAGEFGCCKKSMLGLNVLGGIWRDGVGKWA